ncbi:DNA sulfur modification protein DndD [Cohnella boryungensis]|uniref:DNA sulfur modification protein DndD n=1 Tax=Cohnella boryungensis TaxID=768479 RepID=A0ABV8SGK5_9BACL
MIIKKIVLNNFGPYKGTHEFELDPEKERTVSIIMGHNGAGKTTLLEAIQLGLYGSFVWGLKNMNVKYQEMVKQKFNRIARSEAPEGEFGISVYFQWKTGRTLDLIQLERRWWISINGKLNEDQLITRNKVLLDKAEAFEVEERIRSIIPPSLMEFFLFDGERIDSILRNNDFSTVLREGAINMFGLDIVSRLQVDLQNSFNKDAYQKNIFSDEHLQIETRHELEQVKMKYDDLLGQVTILEQETEIIKQLKENLIDEFRVHGGLSAEEQRNLEAKIKENEMRRSKMNETIKEKIAEHLPFQIASSVLGKTVARLEKEKYARTMNAAYDIIATKGRDLLEEWSRKYNNLNAKDSTESFLSYMIDSLTEKDQDEFWHDVSETELRKLLTKRDEILNSDPDIYRKYFKTISQHTSQIQSYRKKLEKSIAESALRDKWNEIEKTNELIAEKSFLCRKLLEEASVHADKIAELELQLEKISAKLNESQRDESVVNLAEKIRILMKDFESQSLRLQVQKLSEEITRRFTNLIQKKEYVHKVDINPTNFELKLFGSQGIEIPPQYMSAGERQLLLLAIIQAFITTSGRQMPLVLDTLMGRLDLNHRNAIISRFLAQTPFQTIVLATDSEFSKEDIQQLKPVVSKVYDIYFLDETGKTEVKQRGA